MKGLMILLSAFLLAWALSGVACAYNINYSYHLGADGNSFTSPYSGVSIETFDDAFGNPTFNWGECLSAGCTGWYGNSGVIRSGSTGTAAVPFGKTHADNTSYLSVPENLADGNWLAADLALGVQYNYLGLWWGSVDAYNTLEFYYYDGTNLNLVETITGAQAIPTAANGDQTSALTNLYVNITNLPQFNTFLMRSTHYAFEADNIAVGYVNVPEPASIILIGLGILGLAGVRKKFKK